LNLAMNKIYYVVIGYPSKDKGFFGPPKGPKSHSEQWVPFFNIRGIFWSPNAGSVAFTLTWHTHDPGNEKSLCFK
jgi:hypothetical protein